MPLLDIVEFVDPTGKTLVARVPPDGNGELRLGSQCIVREGGTRPEYAPGDKAPDGAYLVGKWTLKKKGWMWYD